jgi:hypothetical protein
MLNHIVTVTTELEVAVRFFNGINYPDFRNWVKTNSGSTGPIHLNTIEKVFEAVSNFAPASSKSFTLNLDMNTSTNVMNTSTNANHRSENSNQPSDSNSSRDNSNISYGGNISRGNMIYIENIDEVIYSN